MKKMILKYGVFAILLCMLAGVAYMLDSFKLNSRTSVQAFILSKRMCRAYVAPVSGFSPEIGDTLLLKSTIGGDISLIVDSVWQEPTHLVILLHLPVNTPDFNQLLHGDGYTPGFFSAGKVRLKELVFKRVRSL